ncbi:MAG: YncE family protein, partial [Candidatus Polarisedimenticolia bacterium]
MYRWRPQAPGGLAAVDLKRVSPRPVRDLARLDARRFLLVPSPDPADRSRRRKGGTALVVALDGPGGGPVITGSLVFEGEGERVVAASDGRAYLLARRRGGHGDEWLVHQADPAAGKILATSLLAGEPLDLAVDSPAGRLYLGTGDRILTLTTSRLIPSWQYRSPGPNRALAIRPGTNRLYVARGREVAIFDPAAARTGDGGPHRQEGD